MRALICGVAAALTLAACDVAHPVAVVGPDNTVFRGTATASFLDGGYFQATNGSTSCQGRYSPGQDSGMVTFPVSCSNGMTGIGKATYDSPRSGGGEITMRDGSRWKFIFGQGALLVR
ncbi:hypothetical protein [Sulfitobacter sp. S190]|uniref:hypothetical protein n=1 Tax=Sulfitobacter sp. S190 TaxID=2867022 RepID=UPI0021A6490D|nr:hypothetical protein [Sulfitobacter sp. S190]UWR21674.1 hypothetical protein K3756_13400 [Sulfitobacter sp. S190]